MTKLIFFSLALPVLFAMSANYAQAYNYIDKDATTPNFLQKNESGAFTNGGQSYCGPTAISNALIWLGKNGYPKLIPKAKDESSAQLTMISILASHSYMGTAEQGGTGVKPLISGLQNYILVNGYSLKSIKFQGIKKCPPQYLVGYFPNLNWIKEGITEKSGESLSIGWYKHNYTNNTYKRTGGHWVTVVGCAEDDRGKAPFSLQIHNPADGQSEKLYLEPIKSGILDRSKRNSKDKTELVNAAGFYKIVDGLHTFKTGILEGALIFRLN